MQPGMQFPNRETEALWKTRMVGVRDVLTGKVDLSAVPFRYVTICPGGLGIGQGPVLETVEWLEQFDWEMVNAYYHDSFGFCVLIRRVRQPQRPGPS
jgi:hypothetical protein